MSTAGQTLTGLSGLSGISAGQHLLAITAGSGGGVTGFATRMTVALTVEKLTVTQKARAATPRQRPTERAEISSQTTKAFVGIDVCGESAKRVFIFTSQTTCSVVTNIEEAWLMTRKEIVSG